MENFHVVCALLGGAIFVRPNYLVGELGVAHIDSDVFAELFSNLDFHIVDFLQTLLKCLCVHLLYLLLLFLHALNFLAKFLFEVCHSIHILECHMLVPLKLKRYKKQKELAQSSHLSVKISIYNFPSIFLS